MEVPYYHSSNCVHVASSEVEGWLENINLMFDKSSASDYLEEQVVGQNDGDVSAYVILAISTDCGRNFIMDAMGLQLRQYLQWCG